MKNDVCSDVNHLMFLLDNIRTDTVADHVVADATVVLMMSNDNASDMQRGASPLKAPLTSMIVDY